MKKKNNKDTILRVLKMLKPYYLRIICSIVLAVIIVSSTLYIPVLSGRAIDMMIEAGKVDFISLKPILVQIFICLIITAISQWSMNTINNSVAYRVIKDMRIQAFHKLMKLPLKYIDSHSHGDIISRIITDVDQFSEGLLLGFTQFFTGIMTILVTLCFMFMINPVITLVVICVTPLSIIVASFIAKKSYIHFKNQSERRGDMTSIVDEMMDGISTVKAFDMENQVCDDFYKADENLRQASLKAIFFSSITNPSTRFVNNLVYAAVGVFGAISAISGRITVGELTCFLSYATQYTKPFNEISGVVTELQNSIACAARVFALLDEEEIPEDDTDAVVFKDVSGKVDIDNVAFSYTPDKPLITDFNLAVNPGQTIAIVGPTGCGKTTLINLLMRFYDVNAGKISIDGVDIRHLARKSLRKTLGMVLQETWLKTGTIKENICMGKPDATDEEIISAAKDAHADSFIRRMPQGYDSLITGEGDNLSAGQRQLLCIARVMLQLPPVLILDEATSSIDTRTEIMIQDSFNAMMKGRTSFIVAHRLSTIKGADVILVMRDGHIVEQGNHNTLIEKGGFYAELYNSQFKTT